MYSVANTFDFVELGTTFGNSKLWIASDFSSSEYKSTAPSPRFNGALLYRVFPRTATSFSIPRALESSWSPLSPGSTQVMYISPNTSALYAPEILRNVITATLSYGGVLSLSGNNGRVVNGTFSRSVRCSGFNPSVAHTLVMTVDLGGTAFSVDGCNSSVVVPIYFPTFYLYFGVSQSQRNTSLVPSMTMFVERDLASRVVFGADTTTPPLWQFSFNVSSAIETNVSSVVTVLNGQYPGSPDYINQTVSTVSGASVEFRLPPESMQFVPPVLSSQVAVSGVNVTSGDGAPLRAPLWLRLGSATVLKCDITPSGTSALCNAIAGLKSVVLDQVSVYASYNNRDFSLIPGVNLTLYTVVTNVLTPAGRYGRVRPCVDGVTPPLLVGCRVTVFVRRSGGWAVEGYHVVNG